MNALTAPLAFGLGVVLAFLAMGALVGAFEAARGEHCEGTIVNGLACIECHRPDRTVITCGVRP